MITNRLGLALLLVLALSTSTYAQGSIFGTVRNADASTPANGQISFVGYLDNTDEEIRIESSDGAGYDAGNWFDDFQNYLTEAPGNPYDYHFYNVTNGQGFVLSALIPNNSFQQENVVLAPVTWAVAPSGLTGVTISGSTVLVRWTGVAGLTYHVYRRMASSNGSFHRIDDPTGSLANHGVAGGYYVDNTTDGVSAYDYLIIAENPAGALSPHSAVLTVNSGAADAPVLASIDPTTGTALGGTLVNVYGSGFDAAGAQVFFGATAADATVLTPFHLTVIAPAGPVGASVDVSVSNTAAALTSNVLTGGFVYSANADPVLAAIGPRTVVENSPLSFTTTASDPDGDTPILTSSALPGTATYVDNGDGTGTFNWTPTFTDAGVYSVTFYATDAVVSTAADSELVVITVTDAGNQAPIVNAINDTTITEGQTLVLTVSATDPDLDPLGLAATDVPTNAAFVDNGDGTGEFTFTPDFSQASVYDVTFTATDTALNATPIVVRITVTNINQVPVLAAIGAQTTDENVLLSFRVSADDADGVVPVLSTSALPGTAVFTDSLNGAGLFEWTPTFAEAGDYSIVFYAADADFPAEVDSETVTVTVVDAGNQAPVLAAIGALTVDEGGNLNVVVTGSDPDGTIPTLTAEGIPTNATFVDNLDGTGTFDFNPDYVQAGLYPVIFIADDGLLADSELVEITVNDAGNIAPVIDPVGDFTVNEGDPLQITITASDPDGGGLFPSLSLSTTLRHYTFIDNGDGTGTLSYNPDFFDAGLDTINFLAIDFGSPQRTATQVSYVTTVDVNQAPVINPIGPFAVAIGDTLRFDVNASDVTDPVDSLNLILSALGVPANASFVDNGDGNGTFTFVPSALQAGPHQVTFLAVDQGTPQLSTTLLVDITAVTENAPPVIEPIGPRVVTEGQTLTIDITASDPDGPLLEVSATGGPEGSYLVDAGNGIATFIYTPGYYGTQRLVSVTIRAFDGIAVTKELVIIQVYDAGNQRPVFDSIPSPSVIEGESLVQVVTASDPDGNPLIMTLDESIVTLPANATFTDQGDGVAEITFDPDFAQSGLYDFSVVAWDGPTDDANTLSDTIVMTVEVVEFGNHAPALEDILDLTFSETDTLNWNVIATDIDDDPITLSTGPLPANATFSDNGSGIGSFRFIPSYVQAGTYVITFYASDGMDTDSAVVTYEVTDRNRPPFVYAPDYSYTIYETDTLIMLIEAQDADLTTPTLSAHLDGLETLAPNMTFVDNGDGTGTFTFIPDYTQGASASVPMDYNIRFRATDEVYTDVWQEDATVVVGVIDRNKPPEVILSAPSPFTVAEGGLLTFFVGVVDDDAISDPNLTVENMPATNATFTYDVPSRSGQFTFRPDFVQAGTYLISFIAIDDRNGRDTAIVQIDVTEAGNQPPSFGNNLPDTLMVPTGFIYEITVEPRDPEGDSITVEAYPMLPNATWEEVSDGTWLYSIAADSSILGSVFEVTFVVTDYPGLASDTLVTHPRIVAFLRGDLDSDNVYSVNDIAYFVEFFFRDGPLPQVMETADIDANGSVSIADLSYLIYYMFRRGPQPAP